MKARIRIRKAVKLTTEGFNSAVLVADKQAKTIQEWKHKVLYPKAREIQARGQYDWFTCCKMAKVELRLFN